MNRIRRAGSALAALALTWLGMAAVAPAAFAGTAVFPADGRRSQALTALVNAPGTSGEPAGSAVSTVTRTVVVGGMPGWQIALIAVGAAVIAATLAVLAYRALAARRQTALSAA